MIRSLTRKELVENRSSLVLLALAQGLVLVLALIADARRHEAMSPLVILRYDLVGFMPIAAITLCQALFARELRSRTILFLEALPISRSVVMAVKLAVASVALLALMAGAYAVVLTVAARTEAIGARFALALAVRTLGFTLAVLGICVASAVLGRYRIPLYLTLIVLAFIDSSAGGDLSSWGPVALVDPLFAVERHAIPFAAFASALGVFVGCTVLALALTLLRDGSVALLLGERMSHREKLLVASTLFGIVFATATLTDKKTKEPYRLTEKGAVTRRGPHASVQVLPGSSQRGAEALADRLAKELEVLAADLEVARLPPVFVIARGDLDAERFETASLAEREGVLVRANFDSAAFDEGDFLAFLVREVVDAQTRGRDWLEPRMWLRDGFSERWVVHSLRRRGEDAAARRDRLALRALYAAERGWSVSDLRRWHVVREGAGEELAAALAWSVLSTTCEIIGEDACRARAADALGRRRARDLRVLFEPRQVPLPIDEGALERRWHARMAAERARLAEPLRALPFLSGELTVRALSASSRAVDFRVHIARPPRLALYSVLYQELWAVDEPLDRQRMEREDVELDAATTGRLPRSFAKGTRLFTAFAMPVPGLGCEVLAGARRRTLE